LLGIGVGLFLANSSAATISAVLMGWGWPKTSSFLAS
jgi:hypothetical protein